MTTSLTSLQRLGLGLYGAAWNLAVPILPLVAPRLRNGYEDRLVPPHWGAVPPQGYDFWIQAASGGEAYLAWELLKTLPQGQAYSVLLTSCTRQGVSILDQAIQTLRKERPELTLRREYFPLDAPGRMRRALRLARPRVLVLLETELWPGLMAAARDLDVPVAVVNGRMRSRSLAGYLHLRGLLRAVAPTAIQAISAEDAARFATLFPDTDVQEEGNVKFDRLDSLTEVDVKDNPILGLLKPRSSFLVLGSVRKEEEPQIRDVITKLHAARPKTTIGLFPRHMERVPQWVEWLEQGEIPWALRSTIDASKPVDPGTVILFDVFGELLHGYAVARAAFVGGSLAPLGGQNFLEPLAQGIVPCIGPHWDNFAWVGQGIVEAGLVKVVPDGDSLVEELVKSLKRPAPPARIKARLAEYVEDLKGGSSGAWDMLLRLHGQSSGAQGQR